MEDEVWKDVVGWEKIYEVSNYGRVRRIQPYRGTIAGRVRKPHTDKDGYLFLTLSRPEGQRTYRVHHLVLFAFNKPRPTPEYQVNHKDFNRANNYLDNLEWLSQYENHLYSRNAGRKEYANKLTEDDVRDIRAARGKLRGCDLAVKYHVTRGVISMIQRRQRWKHI